MKMTKIMFVLALISFQEANAICMDPQDGVEVAKVNLGIRENSGIDFSNTHQGIYWALNDSGKSNIYAGGIDGASYGKFEITGAPKTDWEDIALAKCFHLPGKDCIYIADTGNNFLKREDFTVYVVEEPSNYKIEGKLNVVQTITFKIKGTHDLEAFAVNETKQEFYFISKTKKASTVFSLAKGESLATVIATLDFDQLTMPIKSKDKIITAADFDNASQTLLIGTNDNAFEIKLSDLAQFKDKVRKIKIPKMDQTEAIAYYWKDGKVSVVATSEGEGKTQPLYSISCQ
ncbi:MAG TPA: hypothetical protein VNJ08_11595 [Bacteriovoracaceae bacterium]|nr:hypothetical protein [Bacteriovoracaceae bacterium]